MGILTSIKMAFRNIRGNKTRAFLTMLGIIIGVSSVIVMVSIGQGSSKAVTDQINSLGTNLISINITDSSTPFTLDDANKIGQLNNIKAISPIMSGRVTLRNGKTTSEVALTGTNSPYESIRGLTLSSGRFILPIDLDYRQKVAVLGSDTAATMFPNQSAVGQTMLINGDRYKVVGVLNSIGSALGSSGDDTVIIPFTTAQRLLGESNVSEVYAQAANSRVINFAMLLIQRDLMQIFHSTDSYNVVDQQDVMNAMSSVSKTMTMLLGGIASISLLVGGIGIMNIMFVSVTERTKEIGIRKAIGAKRKEILTQFLIEAIVLSAIGGLIGVGLGVAATKIFTEATGTAVAYSLPVILLSFLFSVAVGVIFGVFPASKASKLHPIEALRFE